MGSLLKDRFRPRNASPIRLLALEAGLPISTSYRYLHEAIDVIAEQAPDLHDMLEQAKEEGWSHLTLDGTLIEIDRVNERNENGYHRWYSGKHKTQGGNVHSPVKGRDLAVENCSYNTLLTAVRAVASQDLCPFTVR